MPSCVVKWCRNCSGLKNEGITFHRFPTNEIQRRKWTEAVRLERREKDWVPSTHSRICCVHFRDDDIYVPNNNNKTRRFRKNAVPICTMVTSPILSKLSEDTENMEGLRGSCSVVQEKTNTQKKLFKKMKEISVSSSSLPHLNKRQLSQMMTGHLKVEEQNPETLDQVALTKNSQENNISNYMGVDYNLFPLFYGHFMDIPPGPSKSTPKREPDPNVDNNDKVDDDTSLYEHRQSAIITKGAKGSSRRHKGYRCDLCRGDIVGFRYTCVECPNFDLCCACEARGQHADHYVLRVPSSKPHSKVQAVIQKIREELFREDDADSRRVKIEIKMEPDLEEEEQQQDPLEQTALQPQSISCQNIKCEVSEESSAVKHAGLSDGGDKLVVLPEVQSDGPEVHSQGPGVQSHVPQVHPHGPEVHSHRPEVQSHQLEGQSQWHKVQSHQHQVHSNKPAVQPKKRLLELEGCRMDTLGVVERKGCPRGAAGAGDREGSYAVYTHRAHHTRPDACAQFEELSTGEELKLTGNKKKK